MDPALSLIVNEDSDEADLPQGVPVLGVLLMVQFVALCLLPFLMRRIKLVVSCNYIHRLLILVIVSGSLLKHLTSHLSITLAPWAAQSILGRTSLWWLATSLPSWLTSSSMPCGRGRTSANGRQQRYSTCPTS